jgi:hypothetical protein
MSEQKQSIELSDGDWLEVVGVLGMERGRLGGLGMDKRAREYRDLSNKIIEQLNM